MVDRDKPSMVAITPNSSIMVAVVEPERAAVDLA